MSTLTSRLKLVKAALIDAADVTVNINPSFDIVDNEIGLPKVNNGSGLPGSPYEGEIRWDRNDNWIKCWDASNAVWAKLFPGPGIPGGQNSWEVSIPTFTNVTLGTGGSAYMQVLRLVSGLVFVKTGFILGTGGVLIGAASVPLPAAYPVDIAGTVGAYKLMDAIGHGIAALSSGGASRQAISAILSATAAPGTINFQQDNTTGGPGNVAAATPFTWASGAQLDVDLLYRTSA